MSKIGPEFPTKDIDNAFWKETTSPEATKYGLGVGNLSKQLIKYASPPSTWKCQNDEQCMDDEWRLFRLLAASGMNTSRLLELCMASHPLTLEYFILIRRGLLEKFWQSLGRMTAVRYLGGILQIRLFWIEKRNQGMPGEKLLRGSPSDANSVKTGCDMVLVGILIPGKIPSRSSVTGEALDTCRGVPISVDPGTAIRWMEVSVNLTLTAYRQKT
ncbi:hypothetical protein BU17DRAFT_71711 [Hysterangium stoloniferum]|nr:hypothetical protein BU17DRAFT_71711 [Hysterangium stoloniferum]